MFKYFACELYKMHNNKIIIGLLTLTSCHLVNKFSEKGRMAKREEEYIVGNNNLYNRCRMKRMLSVIIAVICGCVLILGIQGCNFKIIPEEQEKREVEFVIVSEECLPKEVLQLIENRKNEVIKLTYVDENNRYIIIGYGKQKTGGYSIYIKDFYATDNALYVDTCLMGPKTKNKTKECPSYPVIVLQTSELGLPVVFK